MSRDFHPVSPSLWNSERFISLPDSDARLLALYTICGPHQNSAGCFRVKQGYVLEDLKWTAEQYIAALTKIAASKIVMHDTGTGEIYVCKWFQHKGNIPTNRDHAKGTMKIIASIDSDDIRQQVEADFMNTEWAAKTFPRDEPKSDPQTQPIAISNGLANTAIVREFGRR